MAIDYNSLINDNYQQQNYDPSNPFNIQVGNPMTQQQWEAQRQAQLNDALMSGSLSQEQIQQAIANGLLDPSDLNAMSNYNQAAIEKQNADLQNQIQQYEFDKKRGFDASGRPIQKDWESIANADGTIKDQFRIGDWQNVNANTGALDKLRQAAMRDPGQLSQASQIALQQQQMNQANQMDQATKQGAMGRLRAEMDLAQSGGLSGAARERMAKQSMRSDLLAKQGVSRQGAMDRLGIMSKDEDQRIGALNQLQGMDNQQADIQFKNQQQAGAIQETNTNRALNEQLQKRAWDANQYSQAMQSWAADKSANAQARAAGGGGKK